MCGFEILGEILLEEFIWQILVLNSLPSLFSSCGLFFAPYVEIGLWKTTFLHCLLVFEVLIIDILFGHVLLKILIELLLVLVLALL